MPEAHAPLLLATANDRHLVRSAQGFLLVYRGLGWPEIAQQLRSFDAGEWYLGIETVFRQALAGLDENSMAHAGDLLELAGAAGRARLDPALLDMADGSPAMYNVLHSSEPFRTKARLQALTVLPMLRWELRRLDNTADRVRRRIDAGKSVWEAYLDLNPGRTAILRRIAASPVQPEAWRGKLATLLEILDPLPPEKVPQSEADWNALHSICIGLRLEAHDFFSRHHAALKQRWFAECAQLGWSKAYARLAALEGGVDALTDCFDFLDELANAASWFGFRHEEQDLWQRVTQRLGVFRILEASVRWHRQLWTAAGALGASTMPRHTWPGLLGAPLPLSDGVVAVSLTDASALNAEGYALQHCVGAYWTRCFLGESHIVSLRTTGGQSLSTLEIRLPENGTRASQIIQHRAKANSTPAAELRAQENRLCAHIQQHADFQALHAWRHKAAQFEEAINITRRSYFDFDASRANALSDALGRKRLIELLADNDASRAACRQRLQDLLPQQPSLDRHAGAHRPPLRPKAPAKDEITQLWPLDQETIDALLRNVTAPSDEPPRP